MNNLKQKNVIYKRDLKDVLPHAGKGDSVILASNSNITDIRVNNAMQQLVNNDLYIENRMVAGLNYQPGPEGVQSESAISALPNGSKYWAASNDYTRPFQIYRKVEVPLSQSIGIVRSGVSVNFIAPIGDATFVAFSDKLMYDIGAGFVDCKDQTGANVVGVGYCDSESGAFFVSDNSVYRLVQTLDSGNNTAYSLRKLTVGSITGIKCVQYDASNSMLYLGGANGFIARGRCSKNSDRVQLSRDIQFCANDVYGSASDTNEYITDITINALQILDKKDPSVSAGKKQTNILAATDYGMFRSDTRSFLEVKTATALAGKKCIGVVQRGGIVYVLANDGYVYKQTNAADMVFKKYPASTQFTGPRALAQHTSGLYVACGAGVYRYAQDGEQPELEYPVSGGIDAVFVTSLFNDRIVFAAKGNVVYYYSTAGKVRSIAFEDGQSIKQVVAQPQRDGNGSLNVYVLAEKNGTKRVFVAYIGFGAQKTIDYNIIDGLSCIQTSCDSIVGGGGSSYYFKNGVIYNRTTGDQESKGNMRIYQMEYMPGDNSIAAATNMGLRVFDAATFATKYSEQGTEPANIRFASQNDAMVCFATPNQIFAAAKRGLGSLGNTVRVGRIGSGSALAGVVVDAGKIYALGKATGDAAGIISSADSYYVRQINSGVDVARMAFPAMPYMIEANSEAALGLSDGVAYRLGYSGDYIGMSPAGVFPGATGSINAFCAADNKIFAAVGDTIYQYECSADVFDPSEIGDLVLKSSQRVDGVTRLVYSGTDPSFDMRIYASAGNQLYVYTPSFTNIEKYAPDTLFSDFIMYIDSVEENDEEIDYIIIVGIGKDDDKVHIITALKGDNSDPWGNGTERVYELPDIEEGNDPHTNRTPYAVFFQDNSRVYIAYTAKRADNSYSDYILALATDDVFAGNIDVGTTSDFSRIYDVTGSSAGRIRFTGFNVPGTNSSALSADNEDIDVIATYYKDDFYQHALVTFKVNTNLAKSFNGSRRITYVRSDPDITYFQPDCAAIVRANSSKQYYMVLPGKTRDGEKLRIDVLTYINSNNTCTQYGYAEITGVSSINIADIFTVGFVNNYVKTIDLVVIDTDGKAHSIIAQIGKTVPWSNSSKVLDGAQFKRVIRSGLNQLVGFDTAGQFVYDFQARCKYDWSSSDPIYNIYATDTNGKRDYMLIQQRDTKKIFTSESSPNTAFSRVSLDGSDPKTLLKVDEQVFVITWGETTKNIYKESGNSADHQFELYASGQFDSRAGGYKDAHIYYGVIPEYSYEKDYYVFLLSQYDTGNSCCYVDVYAMIDSSATTSKTLKKVCEFKSPGVDIWFSYISYLGYNSSFDYYTRQQIFSGSRYDWPILIKRQSPEEVLFLNFSNALELGFTDMTPLVGSQCVSIAKNDGKAYCVKIESNKAVVCTIAGEVLQRCDVESTNAWYTGGRCFFQKQSGGVRYHDGDIWRDTGDGQYRDVACVENGLCYFLTASTSDLYESVSIAAYPLLWDPVITGIIWTSQTEGSTPLRLVAGRVYAGVVCQKSDGVRSLCILWPSDRYTAAPTGSGTGASTAGEYNVYACKAVFQDFPDGNDNLAEIVPLGDFLDEIVAYEGGYLHIARVLDMRLIMDSSGTSIIPVINTLPWTALGYSFQSGIAASAKLNSTRYVAASTGLSSFVEGSLGLAMKILSPIMKADRVNARSFYEIGQNTFLIAADKGVYRYQHLNGTPVVSKVSPGSSYNVSQITSYNFTGETDTYVMVNTADSFLYESENCRVWSSRFRPTPATATLYAVYPKNAHEWYFGASSGLYKSTYMYNEVDDINKFTEGDLYALYAEMLSSDISSRCDDRIDQHKSDSSYAFGHLSSLMYDINTKLLSVNFDGLQSSGWQTHSGTYTSAEYSISNDIVFEQFWGNNADQNIALSVENQFVSSDNAKFSYLCKRWMSGITEIYVHIPTTNTYYINHVPSTPNYTLNPDTTELSASNVSQFGKNKIVFKHNPNEKGVYTTIQLALNKSVFAVDQLLDVQACGNSLPLKIYRETIRGNGGDEDYEAAQYFNSYIAPTVLLSRTTNDGNCIFKFACFGADEQVIKLEFIDTGSARSTS